MFLVQRISDDKIFTVYEVKSETYCTLFLIYCDEWVWADSKDFKPYADSGDFKPCEESQQQQLIYIPVCPYAPRQPYDPLTKPYITWTCNTKTE